MGTCSGAETVGASTGSARSASPTSTVETTSTAPPTDASRTLVSITTSTTAPESRLTTPSPSSGNIRKIMIKCLQGTDAAIRNLSLIDDYIMYISIILLSTS